MKKFFSIAFLFLVVTSKIYSQSNDSYPVFVLNDTFSHAQPKGSKIIPRKYQLSYLKGFKLDCSKYDFASIRVLNGGKDPDLVFIVSKSGNFAVELNINGETVIDRSTMQSLDNPKKNFNEFEKGDTPILGIGTLRVTDGKANMVTYWVSMINISQE